MGTRSAPLERTTRRHLTQPFELFTTSLNEWAALPEVYFFFEVIQVLQGQGFKYVNHTRHAYGPGCFFIFTPQDCRSYEIQAPTTFRVLRFTNLLFYQQPESKAWLAKLGAILHQANQRGGPIFGQPDDQTLLGTLLDTIQAEASRQEAYGSDNIELLLRVLLNVVNRNIPLSIYPRNAEPLLETLLAYIHEHIQCPQRLSIGQLAHQFPIAKTYLSEYFLKHSGKTVSQYVGDYRISLAKLLLATSELSIGAIAAELGFIDESHFGRTFKQKTGLTPSAFRGVRARGKP